MTVYLFMVSKERSTVEHHPRTPDPYSDISKRCFDGQVRAWRRRLHEWENMESLVKVEKTITKYDAANATEKKVKVQIIKPLATIQKDEEAEMQNLEEQMWTSTTLKNNSGKDGIATQEPIDNSTNSIFGQDLPDEVFSDDEDIL